MLWPQPEPAGRAARGRGGRGRLCRQRDRQHRQVLNRRFGRELRCGRHPGCHLHRDDQCLHLRFLRLRIRRSGRRPCYLRGRIGLGKFRGQHRRSLDPQRQYRHHGRRRQPGAAATDGSTITAAGGSGSFAGSGGQGGGISASLGGSIAINKVRNTVQTVIDGSTATSSGGVSLTTSSTSHITAITQVGAIAGAWRSGRRHRLYPGRGRHGQRHRQHRRGDDFWHQQRHRQRRRRVAHRD